MGDEVTVKGSVVSGSGAGGYALRGLEGITLTFQMCFILDAKRQ